MCTFQKSESVIVWGNVIGKSDLERFEWDREKRKKKIFENTRKREREKGDKILSLTRVVRLSLSSLSLSGDILSIMRVVCVCLSLSLSQIYGYEFFVCVCVFMM